MSPGRMLEKAGERTNIFLQAIANALEGIVIADLQGNIEYANRSALDMVGFTTDEMMTLNVARLVADQEVVQNIIRETKARGGWKGEILNVRKNKEIFPIILSTSIVMDDKKQPVGIMGVFMDITERKKEEEALKEAQQSLKAIFDSANDGILIADLETKKFHTANNAICKMLGYSLEEIQNLGVMDIHPKEDLPWIIETFEKQSRGELTISADMPVRRKDNSIFYAAVNAGPLTIAKKRYVVGIFRDITTRKEMEKRLMTAERLAALGTFVAGAGHELNNPLSCVIGFSQLALSKLERGKPDREKLKGALEKVASNADRCRAILGSLLACGRGYSVQLASVDLHEVIDEAIALAGHQSSLERIALNKDYSLDIPPVFGNRDALSKVFVNVALNACHAMEGRGAMKVATEREDNWVRIIFQDSGVGIKKEDLHKVFDPFFSTKEVGKGIGLGLSVCIGIVKSHDGDITVQSDGEGRGTKVIISLPIEKRGGYEKESR